MNEDLKLSPTGLALIKKSEGFRPAIYRDVNGNATIGYGHKILAGERFPGTIDETRATEILLADVAIAEKAVQSLVERALTQGVFDALVDFTFNEGAERLQDSTLLRFLNEGDSELACRELYHTDGDHHLGGWIFAANEPQPGLIARRQAEQALWKGESAA